MTPGDPSFPSLHRLAERGWINDPNGLAVIDGRYHVFFQFNPHSTEHADIQWGHVSSTDLVHWVEEPIALAPRPGGPDERGCWSGCLVDDDGVPTAVYTAVGVGGAHRAGAVLATSDRAAVRWEPSATIVPHSDEPHGIEVRDPFVFRFDGRRYAVQGGGAPFGMPRVVLYACDDLGDWTPLGNLLTPDDPVAARYGDADVWECPNLFELDGKWVLVLSPLVNRAPPPRPGEVVALVGRLEPSGDGLRFHPETAGAVDSGASFYAPQVLVDGDRRLMWGWTRDVGRAREEVVASGWTGALTFPRELRLVDGMLRAEPARELLGLRREPVDEAELPGAFELAGLARLRLLLDDEVVVDLDHRDAREARILVDGSVIEVFVDGMAPQTLRAYPRAGSRWRVEGEGLRAWRLGRPDGAARHPDAVARARRR
ncbi:MAG: glycoside hydrolase family 32 protein [Microbacterium sp.]|uniref:glycoside hydrolase family 32 protein n=1 Tax=Microbacterium sp. TaxID=51671 RepID=UPI0039E4C58E